MSIVINAIKARLALLAIVNAMGLVLSGLGKISQDTLNLWTEQAGVFFDSGLMMFGALALVLPGITQFVKVDKSGANKLGMYLACAMALPLLSGCEYMKQLTDADGNPITPPLPNTACYTFSDGSQVCYNQPPPPNLSPSPGPTMPAQTRILPIVSQLEK